VGLLERRNPVKVAKMRQFRLPKWLAEFGIFFFVIVACDSLRKLHATGQPILGSLIDSLGNQRTLLRALAYLGELL
jgi:hypothetical protein